MRTIIACLVLFSLCGCMEVLTLPYRILTVDVRRERMLREAMAFEEQAILTAETADEAMIHRARWEIYAAHLNVSLEERAQRRAAYDRWWEEATRRPTIIQGGEQNCTGYIYQNGYFRAVCN